MKFESAPDRITIFSGHYGSGKTNIAVNYAFMLKEKFEKVAIADLDIVNPYYRTKDMEELLNEAGIRLICSRFANSNVDAPAVPAEAYAICDDRSLHAVADVGGDDRGALAMGRYADAIKEENDFGMYFVINKYRPLTSTPQLAVEIFHEIEKACSIPFTAIVNNSNIGAETTAEDIVQSEDYARKVADITKLPIAATTVAQHLYDKLEGRVTNAFPIKIYLKQQ